MSLLSLSTEVQSQQTSINCHSIVLHRLCQGAQRLFLSWVVNRKNPNIPQCYFKWACLTLCRPYTLWVICTTNQFFRTWWFPFPEFLHIWQNLYLHALYNSHNVASLITWIIFHSLKNYPSANNPNGTVPSVPLNSLLCHPDGRVVQLEYRVTLRPFIYLIDYRSPWTKVWILHRIPHGFIQPLTPDPNEWALIPSGWLPS